MPWRRTAQNQCMMSLLWDKIRGNFNEPMAGRKPRCVVVGAGVVGLTSAIRLLEHGWAVTVIAASRGAEITSIGAGAVWEYPPYGLTPVADAKTWATASLQTYLRLVQYPDSGVMLRKHVMLQRQPFELSQRCSTAMVLGLIEDSKVLLSDPMISRACGFQDAFSYLSPVMDMALMLPWLEKQVLIFLKNWSRKWGQGRAMQKDTCLGVYFVLHYFCCSRGGCNVRSLS